MGETKRNCLDAHPSDWMEVPEEIWDMFVAYMGARQTPLHEKDMYFLYGREERPAHKRLLGWFGDECTGYVVCTVASLLMWQQEQKGEIS